MLQSPGRTARRATMVSRREFLKKSAVAGIGLFVGRYAFAWDRQRDPAKDISLEKAWELHRKCLIIDGHNDVVLTRIVVGKENPVLKWTEQDSTYQTDIPRALAGGQQYVAFIILSAGTGSFTNCIRNINILDRSIQENPSVLMRVLTSSDAVTAGTSKKVGCVYAIEGSYGPLAGNLENLHTLYGRGLRVAGITHKEGGQEPNYLQGTRSESKNMTEAERAEYFKNSIGLTAFGKEVLAEMNKLGVIVDLSHSNDRTVYDVVERSTDPPIVSHTVASALCPTARGLTDDQIKVIGKKGGVMGMTFVPGFIGRTKSEQTIDRFVDHIVHVADLAGIDTVAIGSDYDGAVGYPLLTGNVSNLVSVTQALLNRGFTDEEIRKIWGGNFLRIMKQVVDRPGTR